MKNKHVTITCLSIDCPERKSICCGAISKAIVGDEGTGYYACSNCGKEYVGGKCTAGQDTTKEKWEIEFNKRFLVIDIDSAGKIYKTWDLQPKYIKIFIAEEKQKSFEKGKAYGISLCRDWELKEIDQKKKEGRGRK